MEWETNEVTSQTINKAEEGKQDIWADYKGYPSEILAQYNDVFLYGIFHRIKAFLLYPPNCPCQANCQCEELRAKIVLSLNMDLYNYAEEANKSRDYLHALKFLLKLPDDHLFRKQHREIYSIRSIENDFKMRTQEYHFEIVERLVIALLRLSETYKAAFNEPRTSLKEAMDVILGKTPLKGKTTKSEDAYLGGEKAYANQFATYKSVSHFIAALGMLKGKDGVWNKDLFSLTPDQTEQFLSLSLWFRKELLKLETPNIKMKVLFPDETLLPLPAWIKSDEIHIPIKPYEEKMAEIKRNIRIIDPSLKFTNHLVDK